MKELLDPICSIVWDMLANLCLFAQTTFTSKWLIILGIVFIAVVIFCGYYIAEGNEKGAPVGTAILAFLFFVALFVNILIMAFADFKEYSVATAGDDDDWIFVSVMCALLLCLVAVSIYERVFIIAIIMVISMVIAAAALFSKFAIAIGVVLGIGVLGGGSSYVGTLLTEMVIRMMCIKRIRLLKSQKMIFLIETLL